MEDLIDSKMRHVAPNSMRNTTTFQTTITTTTTTTTRISKTSHHGGLDRLQNATHGAQQHTEYIDAAMAHTVYCRLQMK